MRDRVISWLRKNVSEHRLQHILGVEETCVFLARRHQVDEQQAAQAGLMHDLAKFFPSDKLLRLGAAANIPIDKICFNHPHLLHADISAVLARQEFEINDREVLDAIGNHTLGTPEMSRLSCIVFVADAIEPNRGDNAELVAIRTLAQENLYKCVQQTSDYSLKYLVGKQKVIHPRTILTRNWALAEANKVNKVNSSSSP
jgi:predicted HD superfamily hydrolase involved in NAD metabolism